LEKGPPITLDLDNQQLVDTPWPEFSVLTLVRDQERWRVSEEYPNGPCKNPIRGGLFKNAFTNQPVLVVGTTGSPEENAWCLAQARFDAETFWYRANGSLPIVLDTEFQPLTRTDRNVILYGNADTNRAWAPLLGQSPIKVNRGRMTVGDRSFEGDGLACLFIRPRPDSDAACVSAVAGTGLPGMRLVSQVPYFRSGVGLPDWIILGPEALATGVAGVRGAGFFGNDWNLSDPDSGWAP
jgi:hypothetical protein